MPEEFDLGFDMNDEELYPPPLPEAQYIARCDDIELRKSAKEGSDFNNLF